MVRVTHRAARSRLTRGAASGAVSILQAGTGLDRCTAMMLRFVLRPLDRMRFTAASMLDRQDISNDYLSFKATNWLLGPSDRRLKFALFDTT